MRQARCYFLLLAVLLLLGCSGGGPATHRVSGVIMYDGKPLADAQIGFIPQGSDGETKPARGQTDSQGRYWLTTYVKPGQEANGAMAGDFNVTVTKGLAENRVVEYEELSQQKDLLPPVYADANTTPFTAKVTPGGDNAFDFVLETAAANP